MSERPWPKQFRGSRSSAFFPASRYAFCKFLELTNGRERKGGSQIFSQKATSRTTEAPLIYAVDDMPHLTELYTTLLEAAGYIVRAFNNRLEALAALKAATKKPNLLITDYLGHSMPVDEFIRDCLVVHPTLRILMASGFDQTGLRASPIRADRFIRKPFGLEELQQEVRAALIA
jgi:DNA-binding NtrC family response regulator